MVLKTKTTEKLAKLAHTNFIEARRRVEEARGDVQALQAQRRSLGEELAAAAHARHRAALGQGASSAQLALHADCAKRLRSRDAELVVKISEGEEFVEQCELRLDVALRESKRSDAVHERALTENVKRAALEEQRQQDEHRPPGRRDPGASI